jgi:hypothetical protein
MLSSQPSLLKSDLRNIGGLQVLCTYMSPRNTVYTHNIMKISMDIQADQVSNVAKELTGSMKVKRFKDELNTTEYERAMGGAMFHSFRDAFEMADKEECPERAEDTTHRRSLASDARRLFFVAPIEDPSWLNDLVAYPNWPSTSTLAGCLVGHRPNTALTASSAVQLLQNPLHTRISLTAFEDDAIVPDMYDASTQSRQLIESMEPQAEIAQCRSELTQQMRVENEVSMLELRKEIDECTACGEEVLGSETSLECIGLTSQLGSDVRSDDDLAVQAQTSPAECSDRPACSGEIKFHHTSSYLCGSNSTIFDPENKMFELSFVRMPIRKPDMRSFLPSVCVIKEYDQVQEVVRLREQDQINSSDLLESAPSCEHASSILRQGVGVETEPKQQSKRSTNDQKVRRLITLWIEKLIGL